MYITEIIKFDYRLNAIVSHEIVTTRDDTVMYAYSYSRGTLIDPTDMLDEQQADAYSNIDYSNVDLNQFRERDWGLIDAGYLDTELAYQRDNKVLLNKATISQMKVLFKDMLKLDSENTRRTTELLRIFDKVDFEASGRYSEMLKDYKKRIWESANNSELKTFVGEYRFKQLELKYS